MKSVINVLKIRYKVEKKGNSTAQGCEENMMRSKAQVECVAAMEQVH